MTHDRITLTGLAASTPRRITTSEGLDIASFRLASPHRRYDQSTSTWVDDGTNWYTITAFRQLAINIYNSLKKGDRVIVTGNLRVREWDRGNKTGTTIEVDADAIGHDLSWGTSIFTRTHQTAPAVDETLKDTAATSPAAEPAEA